MDLPFSELAAVLAGSSIRPLQVYVADMFLDNYG